MNRDFKGIWIPKEDIKDLGFRNATLKNAYLSFAPGMTKYQIRKAKKMLPKNKYSSSDIKKIIIESEGNYKCQWCSSYVFCLEEHHYPISKYDGGVDIVKICGKCHSDFHYLYNSKR